MTLLAVHRAALRVRGGRPDPRPRPRNPIRVSLREPDLPLTGAVPTHEIAVDDQRFDIIIEKG